MQATNTPAQRRSQGYQPEVSVIIVNWNSLHYLVPCLESLYGGALSRPFEVIIVDNASRDDLSTVAKHYPDTTILRNRVNRGFAGANNQAIEHATGRYILLLNPDTVPYAGSLDILYDFLETHPEAGVVGPQLLTSDLKPMESYSSFPGPHLVPRALTIALAADFSITTQNPDHVPQRVDWVGGACMLIRREALDRVGLLDEDFFLYFEEADLCWRMKESGWDTYYLPLSRVVHHQGGSSSTASDHIFLDGLLVDEWIRSADQFVRKHLPGWTGPAFRALALVCTVVVLAAWAVFFVVRPATRNKARQVLHAYSRLLLQIPSLGSPRR